MKKENKIRYHKRRLAKKKELMNDIGNDAVIAIMISSIYYLIFFA